MPSAPQNLIATAEGTSRIDLEWDDVDEPEVDQYNIYRSQSTGFSIGSLTFVTSTGEDTTSYSDVDLDSDTTYYYKVTAVDMVGDTVNEESDPSDEANATTDPETTLDDRVSALEASQQKQDRLLRQEELIEDIDEVVDEIFPARLDEGVPLDVEKAKKLLRRTPELFEIHAFSGGRFDFRYSWTKKQNAKANRDLIVDAYEDASSDIREAWFPENYDPVVDGRGLHVDAVGDQSAWEDWINSYEFLQGTLPPNDHLANVVAKGLRTIRVGEMSGALRGGILVYGGGMNRPEGFRWLIDYEAGLSSEATTAANEGAAIVEDAYEELETEFPDHWSEWFGFTEVDVVVE